MIQALPQIKEEAAAGSEASEKTSAHPALGRLEDQIKWYSNKSRSCQCWYKRLKFCQIGLATSIPLSSLLTSEWLARWIAASAGSLIALMEGVQHMNQYSTLWVTYRSTSELLKHEKFLFLSEAGPYRGLTEKERFVLLAERVEERVSTEDAKWTDNTGKSTVQKDGGR
jgi:hypothetical protein